MKKDLGTLDMTKELVAESDALRSALNESGDISHDKAASVTQIYDTLHGIQGCKMIIGDLRLCVAHTGEQGGFSDVRKTDKPYVCNDFQLQIYPEFLGSLTGLGIFGNLHRSSCIVHVSLASAASF